jgi:hypothetical protein
MLKLRQLFVALAVTIVIVTAVPALGLAATPIIHEHFNFTSDPYDDNLCGIDGTSVDRVVVQYSEDASGASIENVNVKTLFAATASGKSLEIQSAGARRASAPIDNGDGTYSIILQNTGPSPKFKLPNGPPLVMDVGLVEFRITFDSATDEFVSFEVLRVKGQRPPGCDQIVAALT